MDETDNQIIAMLRHNGRASYSDLASGLNLTRTTVRSRVEKMEARGDIVGFSVTLKEDVATDPVRGLMMIKIEGRGTERVMRQLSGLPDVRAVHSTNGSWDVIVEIGTTTLEAFDAVLFKIRRFDGVVASETNLLLSTRKQA